MLDSLYYDISNLSTNNKSPKLELIIDESTGEFKKLTLIEDYYINIPAFIDNPSTDIVSKENVTLRIHKGTSTNFASIPWFVRWVISPLDPVIALPAIVHDALVNEFGDGVVTIIYSNGSTQSVTNVDWKTAADTLLGLMKRCPGKLNYFKAHYVYSSVRAYGYIKKFK